MIGQRVRVFTAHLRDKPRRSTGTVQAVKPHYCTGHPEDEQVSPTITVKFDSGEVLGVCQTAITRIT